MVKCVLKYDQNTLAVISTQQYHMLNTGLNTTTYGQCQPKGFVITNGTAPRWNSCRVHVHGLKHIKIMVLLECLVHWVQKITILISSSCRTWRKERFSRCVYQEEVSDMKFFDWCWYIVRIIRICVNMGMLWNYQYLPVCDCNWCFVFRFFKNLKFILTNVGWATTSWWCVILSFPRFCCFCSNSKTCGRCGITHCVCGAFVLITTCFICKSDLICVFDLTTYHDICWRPVSSLNRHVFRSKLQQF